MLDAAANPHRATRRSSNTAYGKVPLQLPHVSASLRRRGCRSCTARRASSAVAANSPEQDAHVEAVPWTVAQPRAILRPHRASDSERSAVARETDSPPPRDMSLSAAQTRVRSGTPTRATAASVDGERVAPSSVRDQSSHKTQVTPWLWDDQAGTRGNRTLVVAASTVARCGQHTVGAPRC